MELNVPTDNSDDTRTGNLLVLLYDINMIDS